MEPVVEGIEVDISEFGNKVTLTMPTPLAVDMLRCLEFGMRAYLEDTGDRSYEEMAEGIKKLRQLLQVESLKAAAG